MSRFKRLTPADLSNLRLETSAAPMQIGGLAIVDGARFVDAAGRLRIDYIRSRLERRIARVPELRKRLYGPRPLCGRALWVDDAGFDISRHVLETAVAPPGSEDELLDATARVMGRLLDRARPLWELWFLTGLASGRIGVLFKLHHAVADGIAAIGMVTSLFDFEADTPDPPPADWVAEPIPHARELLVDSVSTKLETLRRASRAMLRPGAATRARGMTHDLWRTVHTSSAAPRSSINSRIDPGRTIVRVRLDLRAVRAAAHAAGGTVNDVVLTLVAAGLRDLLLLRREPVDGVELVASVPVSLRPGTVAQGLGNQVGVMLVTLPIGVADHRSRLGLIVASTRRAKAEQRPDDGQQFVARLAATPIARWFITHQHLVNVFVTNVIGPTAPVYLLGARILEVVPVVPLGGNVTINFCAFSYDDGLSLIATIAAPGSGEAEAIVAGMQLAWRSLDPQSWTTTPDSEGGALAEPVTAGRRSE
jgi:diacylglycerol O-acyltransferase / wax synthase